MAKVKIVNGKLHIGLQDENTVKNDTKDTNNGIFDVTTPNGHNFKITFLPFYLDPPYEHSEDGAIFNLLYATSTFIDIGEEQKCIIKSRPLLNYLSVSIYHGRINGIYDFISGKWCRGNYSISSWDIINNQIESRFVQYILDYDRECENAKYLKIIGEFFWRVKDRADILDMFTQVAAASGNVKNDDKKDGSESLTIAASGSDLPLGDKTV